MIQRIQTLYLLLVSALMLSMFISPYADVLNDNTIYTWSAEGLTTSVDGGDSELVQPIWALFVLVVTTMALPIVTIFLYKKRLLQMRFCVFNAIVIVGFYLTFGYYWWQMQSNVEMVVSLRYTLLIPLLAIAMSIFAARRILQDEVLVRSLDRIR